MKALTLLGVKHLWEKIKELVDTETTALEEKLSGLSSGNSCRQLLLYRLHNYDCVTDDCWGPVIQGEYAYWYRRNGGEIGDAYFNSVENSEMPCIHLGIPPQVAYFMSRGCQVEITVRKVTDANENSYTFEKIPGVYYTFTNLPPYDPSYGDNAPSQYLKIILPEPVPLDSIFDVVVSVIGQAGE